ncbi:MAG: UDP-glucose--hexose-1-phosphate uridylyltransferase [Lachnospiraceae bacterium]|nr:UDP-glucose--hexose-1-phosphate uridylyltransferase [Lachnospiraceae bacterium]
MNNISDLIKELVKYGKDRGLVDKEDEVYTINRLIELFNENEYAPSEGEVEFREIHLILEDMLAFAVEKGLVKDTIANKDIFDTKIMGMLTPPPSYVRKEFKERYDKDPKDATDYYYHFSRATNYIRDDRIAKDEKWTSETEFGLMDITINLSKPEKDPKDIAAQGAMKKSGYPACLLCRENEGYAGHLAHPARNNHRIIPITLCGEAYNLQYSPYVYYNEHCIIFNDKHTPMKIDKDAFAKIIDFVRQFPHYTAGSNADLPIVGGSILSHDHFQGGGYEFAMVRAPYEREFKIKDFPNVHAGTIKWPLSTIRLQSSSAEDIVDAADLILKAWRGYTDEDAFIYAETDGTPHNTITPIARMRGDLYELDLVLRNNITTDEFPAGVYHPHQEYHHIKRENIGLIEVMGLAVLPARLKKEMSVLEQAILNGEDLSAKPETESHKEWAEGWIKKYDDINADNIHRIVQNEIADVFSHVLEDAGVYKRTEEGIRAFKRFTDMFE